jgi:tetratricopeptide (TPR) repeat protein
LTLFQLILLGISAYFAWQVYKFVQGLQDGKPNLPSDDGRRFEEPPEAATPGTTAAAEAASIPKSTSLGQSVPELIAKADAAYGEGRLSDARLYLERAEKQDPDNPEILNKLAFVLHRQGEEAEALRYYERSLRIDPNDDLTHNAIAEVLRALGRLDEAQEHYKAAVDIDDTFWETYYNYGRLLIEKGDRDGAKMMFEKAHELAPDADEPVEALKALR